MESALSFFESGKSTSRLRTAYPDQTAQELKTLIEAKLAGQPTEAAAPQVEFSPAMIGNGVAFYHQVVAAGHEGVLAKLLESPYWPGKRSVAWKKIKPRARLK